MRKLFKERKLFKGGNYMRKYGILFYLTSILFPGEPANHAKKHWKIFVHGLSQVTTYCHNYFYVQKEPILIEKF